MLTHTLQQHNFNSCILLSVNVTMWIFTLVQAHLCIFFFIPRTLHLQWSLQSSVLETILIFKISHHGRLKLFNLKASHQILAVQIDFRTYKLSNLLAELINMVAINSSQSSSTSFFISSPPLSESLKVHIYLSRGSFYSSCQVKGNSKDSLGVFNSPRKTVNHIYRSLFCWGESDKFAACAHVHL